MLSLEHWNTFHSGSTPHSRSPLLTDLSLFAILRQAHELQIPAHLLRCPGIAFGEVAVIVPLCMRRDMDLLRENYRLVHPNWPYVGRLATAGAPRGSIAGAYATPCR